ncbi:MAG: hypothetical protein RL375_1091, partial [Pseudomonadota bacterium]
MSETSPLAPSHPDRSSQDGKTLRLYRPVAGLLGRLSLSGKLMLVGIMLAVPLVVGLTQLLLRIDADLKVASTELRGTHVTHELLDLMSLLQDHRAALALDATPAAMSRADKDAIDQAIRKQLVELDNGIAADADFGLTNGWNLLRPRVEALG